MKGRALRIQRGLSHFTMYPSGLFVYWFKLQGERVHVLFG